MSGASLSWRFVALGGFGHDRDRLLARTEELLSRPPFEDATPGPVRRVLQWLGDGLARLLENVLGNAVASGLLPWLLVILGVALLGWLVWRITRGLSVDASVAEVPAQTVSRSAADWDADADAAAGRGELREALRCRYAAMAATLIEGGVLDDVPGRTVRELDAAVVAAVPAIADEVRLAGERFDEAVYGHREVTREHLEVVTRAARSAAERGARAGVGS